MRVQPQGEGQLADRELPEGRGLAAIHQVLLAISPPGNLQVLKLNYQNYYQYRKIYQIISNKFIERQSHISQENMGTITRPCH